MQLSQTSDRQCGRIQTTAAAAGEEGRSLYAPSRPQSSRSQETVHQAVLTQAGRCKRSYRHGHPVSSMLSTFKLRGDTYAGHLANVNNEHLTISFHKVIWDLGTENPDIGQ